MQIAFNRDEAIELIQITDPHLGDAVGEKLLGLDTDYSLQEVVATVSKERDIADLLLATGDIASGGAASAYHRFLSTTADLARQTLWLPGNHDSVANMRAASDNHQMDKCVDIGNWRIVMLNSKTPNAVGGSFSDDEMLFLEQCLNSCDKQHVLLCLHHHPYSVGCDWLDKQQLANSSEFLGLMDQHPQIKGVLWGHVHQAIDQFRDTRNGGQVRMMATPSTCIQFAANSADFQLARLNPGYRWLQLLPDGDINSGVSRVTGVEFSIDYADSSGY